MGRSFRASLAFFLSLSPVVANATTFVDVARDANLDTILQPSACGVGVSIVDVNGDGDFDVFTSDGPGLPVRLWINQGNMTFQERATQWGLTSTEDGRSGVFGDYDNDGDLDLFLGNWAGPNQLYRNDGSIFTDVTASSGVGSLAITNGASWGDVDGDGRLDLFVCIYDDETSNILYRNEGGGVFTDVTTAFGVTSADLSFQPVFTDFDRDGDQDIFITNDKDYLNELWRNDGGTFTNVASSAQVAGPFFAMGSAVGDFDRNGTMDLYVTNVPDGNFLFANDGGSFTQQTTQYQLEMNKFGWATEFLDYDNDGDEDLYVVNFDVFPGPPSANALFRNDGVGVPFVDVASSAGVDDDSPGFGLATADLDGDGYLEIVVSNFFEFINLFQSSGGANNWLELELRGSASNSYGIGAWIEIEAGGVIQHREIRTGSGYLSQSPPMAHFGLGVEGIVDRVVVRWPSGLVQVLSSVSANQRMTVFESSAVASPHPGVELPPWIASASPNPFNPRVSIRFRVATMSTVTLSLHDVSGRRVRDLGERRLTVGDHEILWDGQDDRGVSLASGVYRLVAESKDRRQMVSLTLLR